MLAISIIIPVYNSAQFLLKCLESVCNQTLQKIEIICVNDCSTDGSFSILEKYAKSDKRIKLIDLKENKGAAAARNIGIENATGQYLGFVDSDDFIDLNFYEKLHEKALENNCDVVKGNIRHYYPKTKSITKEAWIDINEDVKNHKAHFYFSFTTAIYKTSIIRENNVNFLEGLIHFEDPFFTIKAALFYQKLEVIDDVFYYYVNNPNSASRREFTMNHMESLIVGVGAVLDLFDEYSLDKEHYIIVFNFLLEQLLCCRNRVDVKNEVGIKANSGLDFLRKRCRYKKECEEYYIAKKKKNQNQEVIKQLRNKVKYDFKKS